MKTSRTTHNAKSFRDHLCWLILTLGVLGLSGCDPKRPPHDHGLGGPMCGGIAAIECPGAGDCVDDASDSCDPGDGGADCSGLCECNAIGLCVEGYVWDSSPHVCDCVPDYDPCIAALCPVGTMCTSEDGEVECVPFDAGASGGGESCGDAVCDDGMVCCNASCGICTPPDGACIQIECTD